jgi:general secretion pathway protein N
MKVMHLIIAGAVAFLIALIAQAPMPVLWGWVAPKESSLELYGLQGTLMKGSVAGIGMQGRGVWQELNWSLHPLGFLTGRVVADIETQTPAAVRSKVALTPWGTSLSDVRASGSIRSLLGVFGQGFLPIEGQVAADLKSLELKDGKPAGADGTLDVEALSWTLAKDPVVLGNFRATATTENSQIVVKIESVSGPLDVSGTANLDADQAYSLDLRIKVKPGATSMVQTLVQSLGRPDSQGYYTISRKGKLA